MVLSLEAVAGATTALPVKEDPMGTKENPLHERAKAAATATVNDLAISKIRCTGRGEKIPVLLLLLLNNTIMGLHDPSKIIGSRF